MSLFKFGKKKEKTTTPTCSCNGNCSNTEAEEIIDDSSIEIKDSIISIKVLGAGCKSCHEQYENAKEAVKKMKLNIEVEYITDIKKVMEYGVMSMPALVINDKIVAMGKILKSSDVEKLLHKLGV